MALDSEREGPLTQHIGAPVTLIVPLCPQLHFRTEHPNKNNLSLHIFNLPCGAHSQGESHNQGDYCEEQIFPSTLFLCIFTYHTLGTSLTWS